MYKLVVVLFLLALVSSPGAAAPAVGTVSQDLGYSQGTTFSSNAYTVLEHRHLSDHTGKVMMLFYFTPW